jgi:hypothetical protein
MPSCTVLNRRAQDVILWSVSQETRGLIGVS